jgi:hypothetical protein
VKTAIAFVCGCLLLSGCARNDINKMSVFQYEAGDSKTRIALKTAGNIVPWIGFTAVGLAMGGVVLAVMVVGQSGLSGGIDSHGVHINN